MDDTLPILMLLVSGLFVLLAAAGFAMLNTGLSRAHASATLCLTSIGTFAISALAFYILGANIMYHNVTPGGFFGSFSFFYQGKPGGTGAEEARWFFHLSLAVLASSIILGALTERIRAWPYMAFAAIFSAIIYPLEGSWSWGGGWLSSLGFHDYAGSAVIHMAAGCAALTGSYIMGPRAGRYAPDGRPIPFSGSNIPLASLGALLIWIGWFGLNGGHGSSDLAHAFINTVLGGAGGAFAALIYVTWRYNKPDPTIIINALLAGLVSVSGGADIFVPIAAMLAGAVGGVLCAYTIPLLDKYKIDDPVGVIPVHLVAGMWGTFAVIISGNVLGQIAGLLATLLFTGCASALGWIFLKRTLGLRCTARAERHGLDMEAVGLEAYPDFPIRTAGRPDITQIDKY